MPDGPGIAVVGSGAWGTNHVRVWSELGLLRWVCDVDRSRLDPSAGVHRLTSSLDEVLLADDVDAVVVATPAETHTSVAAACIAAGKDVLVEKPLALDTRDATELVSQAEAADRVLMVGHVLLFHPAVGRLHDLVRDGALGHIRYIYSNRLNFGRIRTEESALWSFAPHDVAIMIELLGSVPESVSCHGSAYLTADLADVTLTHLRFAGSISGHIYVSWLHPFKEHRLVVVGDRRMAVFDDTAPWPEKLVLYEHQVDWVQGTVPVARKATGQAVPLEQGEPLRLECEAFVEAIRTRSVPLANAQNGLDVLRVLTAAEQSQRNDGALTTLSGEGTYVHPTAIIDPGVLIGNGTRVWHHAHVMSGVSIGPSSVLGKNVFVGRNVRIGEGCKIQNNVSVFEGVVLEDRVFCGPSVVFTNVRAPRADFEQKDKFAPTLVREGATLGANATIVCGNNVGAYAFVAAGAVVTKDVPNHALVVGSPARIAGWVCSCGQRIDDEVLTCPSCGSRYIRGDHGLRPA